MIREGDHVIGCHGNRNPDTIGFHFHNTLFTALPALNNKFFHHKNNNANTHTHVHAIWIVTSDKARNWSLSASVCVCACVCVLCVVCVFKVASNVGKLRCQKNAKGKISHFW